MKPLACTLLLWLAAIPGLAALPQVEAFDRYWRALEEFLGPP